LIILIVAAGWLKIANLSLSARVAIAEKNIKGYEAAVALQNEGIKQMQEAGDVARKKAEDATKAALEARKQSKTRVITIMSDPVPVACDEARRYGIDLAKKLVGQKP
jgi:hypothetical protein